MKTDADLAVPFFNRIIYRLSRHYWLAVPAPAAVWYLSGSGILTLTALMTVNSLLTWLWFYEDKLRAESQWPRIPEWDLHLWEALGGWPGALLAQKFCRHKSAKIPYRLVLLLMILLNCGALYGLYRLTTYPPVNYRLKLTWEFLRRFTGNPPPSALPADAENSAS